MLIGGAIGGAVLILFSVVLGGSLRAFFGALTAGAVGGIYWPESRLAPDRLFAVAKHPLGDPHVRLLWRLPEEAV